MPLLTTRRIVATSVVVAAAVGAYYAFRPSQQAPAPQRPVALLHVDPRPPGLLPGGTVPTPGEIETYRKTQAALVRSEFVANAALRDPKLRELEVVRERADPAVWLAEHLTADYGENSSVLRIGVTGVPPRDAALLANAVAGAFLNEVVQKDIDAQKRSIQRLEDARAELTRALDEQKKELDRTAAAAGVPPNPMDHRALLASLYQERTGLRVEMAKARAEKGAREKPLREELTALDERIRSCERADLDLIRAEVARLEAAVTAVAGEITRLRVEMSAPPRVTVLALATVPGDAPVGTASLRH